jgi:hypothetical protein
MGFENLKGLTDKAKDLLEDNKDKISDGVEKAGDLAKDKVSGHDEQIDKAVNFATDKLGGAKGEEK